MRDQEASYLKLGAGQSAGAASDLKTPKIKCVKATLSVWIEELGGPVKLDFPLNTASLLSKGLPVREIHALIDGTDIEPGV